MTVCQRPVKIQNGFFEFLDYGPGVQPRQCPGNIAAPNGLLGLTTSPCNNLLQTYDRESTPILGTLAGTPQQILVYPSDQRDAGKLVIIAGNNTAGLPVTSTDAVTGAPIFGEVVTLAFPFAMTANAFTSITAIQKDFTYGGVVFFQMDPVTGVTSSLSSMENNELTANYRRYLVNGLPPNCCNQPGGAVTVQAMAKLDFIPVVSDPDYLLIPCIPALMREMESIRYDDMDNQNALKLGASKHQDALALLFGQLTHYLGNERPAITVPLWGSDRLRLQPI
jgi:hypothetical protein